MQVFIKKYIFLKLALRFNLIFNRKFFLILYRVCHFFSELLFLDYFCVFKFFFIIFSIKQNDYHY